MILLLSFLTAFVAILLVEESGNAIVLYQGF